MNPPLAQRLAAAPVAVDGRGARLKLKSLLGAEGFASARDLAEAKRARALLTGIADHSPYLWTLITEDPARAARLLLQDADFPRSALYCLTRMERALKTDHPVALGLAGIGHGLAHGLHQALIGLRPGIAEEHRVRKTRRHVARRQPLRPRHPVQIGTMDQLAGLLGDRRGQPRMCMPQRAGRDPGAKIQISPPRLVEQIGALPMRKSDIGPVIVRH